MLLSMVSMGAVKKNTKVGVFVGVGEDILVGEGVNEGVTVGVNNFAVCVAAAAAVRAMIVSTPSCAVGGTPAGNPSGTAHANIELIVNNRNGRCIRRLTELSILSHTVHDTEIRVVNKIH